MTKKLKILLLLAVLFFVAVVIFAVYTKKSLKRQQNEPKVPDLSLDIKYKLFMEGYTVPVIIIKNLNEYSWTDCQMEINDKYVLKKANIENNLSGQNIQIIPVSQFVRDNGNGFDYEITKLDSIFVSCNKPQYDSIRGEFRLMP